jgi:hypothetical protein
MPWKSAIETETKEATTPPRGVLDLLKIGCSRIKER